MRRLTGWQPLGVILVVVWLVASAAIYLIALSSYGSAFTLKVGFLFAWVTDPTQNTNPVSPYEALKPVFSAPRFAGLFLIPILFVGLMARLAKWVRAGFSSTPSAPATTRGDDQDGTSLRSKDAKYHERAYRLSFAASISVALGLGFAAGMWYSSRGHQGRWNSSALRPTLHAAQLEGEPGKLSPPFFYQLENTTNQDYEIRAMSDVELFIRVRGALDSWIGPGLAIDLPVVVPPKQKANVTIHFKFVELEQPSSSSQADVQRFLKDQKRTWNDYDGIVLLDKRWHYQIDFPFFDARKSK